MLSATIKKQVKQMRDLVANTHWIKRDYFRINEDGKDQYCLVGMIAKVTDADWVNFNTNFSNYYGVRNSELGVILWEAIRKQHPRSRAMGIEDWNDSSHRKREEVLAVLDSILEDNK